MTPVGRHLTFQMLLILLVAGLAGCNRNPASSVAKPAADAGQIGSRLPSFSVTDLNGHPLSAADLKGEVVLVDFWATWCQPCKKEMPGYQELLDRYGASGFAVVGFKATMMLDTEPPLVFARENRIRYPLAIATPSITDDFGGIQGLPTTFIFDRSGVLRQKIIGFEYTYVIESYVKPLLGTIIQTR
jgi:thiol-disulfide isomerase/thioredoxin